MTPRHVPVAVSTRGGSGPHRRLQPADERQGTGFGGTCSGDSGGPVFLGDTPSNLIVAVTSFGLDEWCRGTDFSYRVDRQEVLDWIAEAAALADAVGPG